MLSVRGLIPLRDVGLTPLRGGTGSLVGRAIRPGVGIVSLAYALFAIGGGSGCPACISAGVRIVLGSTRSGAISTISGLRIAVCSMAGVIR